MDSMVDASGWPPCPRCAPRCMECESCSTHIGCGGCEDKSNFKQYGEPRFRFCPDCGRPQTAEAWAEMEKRLDHNGPSDDPLTPEELKQMAGNPVWVVLPESNVSFWALIREEWLNGMCMSTRENKSAYEAFELYGKTWLAYRRRPGVGEQA